MLPRCLRVLPVRAAAALRSSRPICATISSSERKIPQLGLFQRCLSTTPSRSWDHGFLTHAEVAKRFEEFDKDGDGLITVAECKAAMDRLDREVSDGVVRESMWSWDGNRDGVVDYFEFMDYFLQTKPDEHVETDHDSKKEFDSMQALLDHCTIKDTASVANSLSRQAKAELINSFKSLDTNQDGFLDREELTLALRYLNPDAGVKQIEILLGDIIAKGDKNGDGLIDLYEFSSRIVQQQFYQ